MGREIYNIINDMAEVLNASQMQRLQEVLEKRLSENAGYNKYSGDKVKILRDNCNNLRDRALIDFWLSTGIRVGELVRLNIDDIDFSERECVVYGKGDKERKAYFDAKTKIHLLNYIESRTDDNSALFVSLDKTHSRLTESGVELRLWEMGKKLGVEKVHPHKFRRTMATRAIEKGMPIEQVQKILGHEQIDTNTMVSITEANQNFSKVARLVDELGSVVILKNNAPRYLVIDFSKADDSAVAKDEDVLEISKRLLAQNKEAYEVLAK